MKLKYPALLALFSAFSAQATVSINEIRIDQPGADNDEYFELHGPASDPLAGLTYLVIGDGTGGSGVIEAVVSLDGQAISASGFFLAAESTFTMGTANLTTSLNFENSDNVTHLLVSGFSGANGDDLDIDDDGVLDVQPWTEIIDSVAIIETPDSGEKYYSDNQVGPDGTFVPGQVYRVSDGTGAFQIGDFAPGPDSTDTPGLSNGSSEIELNIAINEIRIDQSGPDNDEYFELFGTENDSLDGLTYLVIGDGSGGSGVIEAVVSLDGKAISASGFFLAAESTFTLGTANLTTSLNFENSDNVTHLLVSGFSGANGDDLDIDDDGVLDVQPWTEIIDSVALIETPDSSDKYYSDNQVGPNGIFAPAHVFREPDGTGGFAIGEFALGPDSNDTPGASNVSTVVASSVAINEIRIDQSGSDNDEYFELFGTENGSLDGLTYLVIGDGSGGSGAIEAVVSLDGKTISASGFFLAAESTFTLGTADFITSLNFENSDNVTHLLVRNFTGANGDDLDTNDDGVLDVQPWDEVVDSVALIETPDSGDKYYSANQVGPNGNFVPAHVYRDPDGTGGFAIGEFDLGTDDTPGASNGGTGGGGGTPAELGACSDAATFIHEIQGSGDVSPKVGENHVIEGVVTGVFQADSQLGGFFMQEEDADADADPATSEGIFVFDSANVVTVNTVVRVQGSIDEFFGLTQMKNVTGLLDCGTTVSPTVSSLTLPLTSFDEYEQVEGMSVFFSQPLTVTEYFNLDRFGQITLADERTYQFTHNSLPDVAGYATHLANKQLNQIILDDGSSSQNPETISYFNPTSSATNTLRGGSIANIAGVMSYSFGNYVIQPTGEILFSDVNPRTDAPDELGGNFKVAGINVLNYFTTLDVQGSTCGPNNLGCRGAESVEEFIRQRDKTIAAISIIDADILGLVEIENNATESLSDLVNGLNAVVGAGTYAFVNTGTIGTDAIKVGVIYKPASATPTGAFAVLDSSVDPLFLDNKNRPALAQTFTTNNGEVFTIAVNHLKSKGSNCDSVGDPDTNDGQGNCAGVRAAAATALVNWLANDPTASGDADFLILGDLNAYAKEDAITNITDAGYTNLVSAFGGPNAYSYVFNGELGYLDYAIASASLTEKVTGVTEWHINSDEPDAFDYNTNFRSPDQIATWYSPDAYRMSDHDPVIVGLDLNVVPRDKNQCKKDGWKDLNRHDGSTFKNQGQCVSYVNTGK